LHRDDKVHLQHHANCYWTRRLCSIAGFFEENIVILKFQIPKRLLVPLLIVLAAKIAGSIFVYYSMNIGASGTFWTNPARVFSWEQNSVFLQDESGFGKFPLVFVGWDSAWYLTIMEKGYAFSLQSYSFSPGLPFFGELFYTFLRNPMFSIVTSAFVFGVLWIPLYQMLAESYIGKRAAMLSALLLALFPYVFLFTTVAYSEGLLLFFVLSTWLLFKRGKVGYALPFAVAAPLMRTMGILVIFPMLFYSLKQKGPRRIRDVLLSFLPVVSLALWFVVSGLAVGDVLAPVHTTEWSGLYSFRTLLMEGIPQKGIQALLTAPVQPYPIVTHWLLPVAVVCALTFPPFLIYKAAKTDKLLTIYSLAGYLGVLVYGALVSTPRFMALLFPLWIPLTALFSGRKKSIVIAAIAAVAFLIVAIDLWTSFLNGQFVA